MMYNVKIVSENIFLSKEDDIMEIKLRFLGAAENVTGSRHLLEAGGKRILVDCGLYQERALRERNWEPFVVGPESIDAVLLTHAHLDHCGQIALEKQNQIVRQIFKTVILNVFINGVAAFNACVCMCATH